MQFAREIFALSRKTFQIITASPGLGLDPHRLAGAPNAPPKFTFCPQLSNGSVFNHKDDSI
jgi:hypothetical protein